MRPTFILILLVIVNVSYAQSYEFLYDNAGNRTARIVITLSNNSFQSDQSHSENQENQDSLSTQLAGISCIVYPNPTKGLLNLEILEEFEGDIYCQITDAKGQQVLVTRTDKKKITFDCSPFKAGIYILYVQHENTKSTIKIIKN